MTIEVPLASALAPLVIPRVGKIVGRVVDPHGASVAGARVHRVVRRDEPGYGGPRTRATCDAGGRFEIERVSTGTVHLLAEADGFARSAATDVVVVPGVGASVDLFLRVGATIDGVLYDRLGRPEAGAKVLASANAESESESRETRTDERGRFRFEHLIPASWTVWREYQSPSSGLGDNRSRTVALADGDRVEMVLGIASQAAATIRGRVTVGGRATSAVIQAVRQNGREEGVADQQQSTTRDDGTFELLLLGGEYELFARTSSGSSRSRRVSVPLRGLVDVDFAFGACSVRGRIVDADQHGVGGMQLSLSSGNASYDGWNNSSLVSADDGSFAFDGLDPGRFELYVTNDRRRTEGGARWGSQALPEIELTAEAPSREITVLVQKAAGVKGVVLDASGRPVQRAWLSALGPLGSRRPSSMGMSDEHGRFEMNDLVPGRCAIVARSRDGVSRPSVVDVGSGEVRELTMTLVRAGGVVIELDGAPSDLEWTRATFIDEQGYAFELYNARLNDVAPSPGLYRFFPLAPGKYRVIHRAPDGRESSADVSVTTSGDARVRLGYGG